MTILTTIVTIILSIIAVGMFIALVLKVASCLIADHNIRKYGCWWGEMPEWLVDIVNYWS